MSVLIRCLFISSSPTTDQWSKRASTMAIRRRFSIDSVKTARSCASIISKVIICPSRSGKEFSLHFIAFSCKQINFLGKKGASTYRSRSWKVWINLQGKRTPLTALILGWKKTKLQHPTEDWVEYLASGRWIPSREAEPNLHNFKALKLCLQSYCYRHPSNTWHNIQTAE